MRLGAASPASSVSWGTQHILMHLLHHLPGVALFGKLLVSWRTATVLGRTVSGASSTNQVSLARIAWEHSFEADVMLTEVAHVVVVLKALACPQLEIGRINCGSAMTPCSWFPELARLVRENPALDMGLHLPVTSEHAAYRWRPVSRPGPDSGPVDEAGYFHRRPADTARRAAPDVIIGEVEAQIRLLLKLGLTPTHLDSRHGILYNKDLVRPFVAVAQQYHLATGVVATGACSSPACSRPVSMR